MSWVHTSTGLPRERQSVLVVMQSRWKPVIRHCVYERNRFYDYWTNQQCRPQPFLWMPAPCIPLTGKEAR